MTKRGQEPARYRATKPYDSPYERTLEFSKGERLHFERRESPWRGWIWCTAPDGREAWVPEAWADCDDEACEMTRDYSARELSLAKSDEVTAVLEESGWIWATNEAGHSGWVPLDDLERVSGESKRNTG